MTLNSKSKAMVFFSIMYVLLLFISGCGSDSNPGNTDPPTGGNGNPVDASLSDFIGTWGMWEQRGYTDLSCGGPDSAAEKIEYNIKIEQNGNQVQLNLFDDDNQSLSCKLDDNELVCQGTYNWGDGWRITYNEYRIYFIGVGHSNLQGEVTWTISYKGETCSGTSGIDNVNSSGQPGDGHPGGGGPVDPGEENCTNGVDDDGDGAVDCEDPKCIGESVCQTDDETNCDNDSDDDGDGDVDCEDADCAGDPACNGGGGLVCAPEVCSPVCPSGNCSTCVTSGNCDSTCTGGNCDQQCGGNNTQCNFECGGGNCDMSCQDSAHCNMACPGGNCQMTCTGDADCNMTCSGGNCDVTCDTTGTCITPP